MTESVTATIEDYLGLIYVMQREGQTVLGSRLAERMGVSHATVTATLKRMDRDGLIEWQARKDIALTSRGLSLAQDLIRRHMLAEWLLCDVLGIPWHRLHLEADRLEHSLSEEATRRLATLFEQQHTCPHGNPMPGTHLPPTTPLDQIAEASRVKIVRIVEEAEEQPELLSFLEEKGLLPGSVLQVLEHRPYNETITVQVGEQKVALGLAVAALIHVQEI
ncbi:MAG: metal-dependent transcriptional regulator [Chloroflexia bacterium]|nr:metal-dependent transcriptional regulator [Chloroflexia bacterium]